MAAGSFSTPLRSGTKSVWKKKMSRASGNKRCQLEHLDVCFDYLQTDLFCACQDFDFVWQVKKKTTIIIPLSVAVNCDDDADQSHTCDFSAGKLQKRRRVDLPELEFRDV